MTNRSSAAHDAAAKEGQPGNSDDPNTARESRSGTGGADGHEAVPFATRRGSDPEPADDPAPVRRPVTADAPDPAPGQPKGPGGKAAQKSAPPAGKKAQSGQAAGPQGQKPGRNAGKPADTPPPKVRPVAGPAKLKKRHWGLITSFLFLTVIPFVATVAYLFTVAEDQYHSIAGFTVRSQEQGGANELLGGLADFAGASTASDSDILYEFIQSQEMVESVNQAVDLRTHYSQYWPNDWVFSIWSDASQEDLIWYWNRMVGVSYDASTGLIEVQVKAFDAQMAKRISSEIVAISQARINELNLQAREDAMRYAQDDLDEAIERLKNAREAITEFRTRSQIVDPETDIQTRMGVMTSLQQQLASVLVEYDLLRGTSSENDPRIREAQQRIEVIRDRIAIERRNFASSSTETGGVSQDYPSLIAEFERLTVDRQYAEQAYTAALTALETARDEANRQSRYLATYIKPTLAQASEYPQRLILTGLAALFLLLFWSILALVYYSIRDRS
ncbi:sugar transporter [Roseovarius sp.]|uniref:sugar transporter n=1 Tax=Roseovarius sp. TaxID=1486281 RepID=UPI0026320770|nr:sugar transporter [Roseovarius sp.]MDM8166064.1 sugar transporter [Roseovarius sp.]